MTDFYTPNPDRMRDWISIPKSNGYESLHTTVVTDTGRWVEIQIRSERMDEIAERGVAAHWRYKGVKGGGLGTEQWFSKLREIMETTQTQSLAEKFDAKLSSGEVFVFTPNGDLRKLSEGATVLDFAFDIHSGLGMTCVGGKVNHRNVSLREVLHNGDIVEILTSKQQKPKADWLNIVTTAKARSRIKAYMREQQAQAASLGREELERKIKNWKLSVTMDDAVMVLCKYYKLKTGTELYGQIAQQKIVLADIKEVLTRYLSDSLDERPVREVPVTKVSVESDDALIIDESLSNIEYKLAKCCNPIFGDEIFVSRASGPLAGRGSQGRVPRRDPHSGRRPDGTREQDRRGHQSRPEDQYPLDEPEFLGRHALGPDQHRSDQHAGRRCGDLFADADQGGPEGFPGQ